MADQSPPLEPHPLVRGLATSLSPANGRESTLEDATKAARGRADRADIAKFADKADLSEVVMFAGYVGPRITQSDVIWWVLYLDANALNWLLVRESDIALYHRGKDDNAAFAERDVIWVKTDARVVRGSGPQSIEARFLTGDLTRAGDFISTVIGGTRDAGAGILDQAFTPLCCTRRSYG